MLSDDEQLERQLLAYFDDVNKNIIFEQIESPSNKGPIKVKLRRPPIFQGHLKAEKRFACITQQCQLSALFLEDSESNGPILTSFLSRNNSKELVLSNKDSTLPQVQENSEIVGFSKLDVLSDDNEEVVICNATGLTYILSSKTNQEIIRYHHRKGKPQNYTLITTCTNRTVRSIQYETYKILLFRHKIFHLWYPWLKTMFYIHHELEYSRSIFECPATLFQQTLHLRGR